MRAICFYLFLHFNCLQNLNHSIALIPDFLKGVNPSVRKWVCGFVGFIFVPPFQPKLPSLTPEGRPPTPRVARYFSRSLQTPTPFAP